MAQKQKYICSECGDIEPKWLGRCPECGNWNSFSVTETKKKTSSKSIDKTSVPLESVEIDANLRINTGIDEFNRALMDWARFNEIQNPEQYYVDPESDASKTALANKSKQAEELDMQKKTLMQQAFGLQQMQNALDKYKHDSELQFKYFAETLGAELGEADIVAKAMSAATAKREADGQTNATSGNGPGSEGSGGEQTTTDDPGGASWTDF